MAWERPVLDLPGQFAGEDFSVGGALKTLGYQSSGQFLFVKMNPSGAANSIVHCNNHRDRMVGVSQGNSALGDALQVRAIGVSKIVAGEALVGGQAVGTNNSGQAVHKNETSTGADYGDFVAGVVLEGVAAAGSLVTVLISSPYRI